MTRRTLTWISCSIDVIARNRNIEPMNIRFIRTTANLYDITSTLRWNGGINSNFKRANRRTGKNRINPTESHNHHPINIYYYSAVVERCDCWLWPFAVIAFHTAHNFAAAGICRAFSLFLFLSPSHVNYWLGTVWHGFPTTIFHIFHRWIIINCYDFIIVFQLSDGSCNIMEFNTFFPCAEWWWFPDVFIAPSNVSPRGFFLSLLSFSHRYIFLHSYHLTNFYACGTFFLK